MSNGQRAWLVSMSLISVCIATVFYLNPSVGFANADACDAWYFFGIYKSYSNIASLFPSAYQISRFPGLLPWIYLAPHLSVVAFHDVKFWTYTLLTAAAFAYAAIKLFGPRIGPFVAVLFSCSTLVIGVFSHDYVTGAGLFWETGAIAATLYGASRTNQVLGAITTGVFYALAFWTHVPTAMFIFAVPLFFFAVSARPQPLRSFVRFNLLGLLGFVATTLAFCILSWSIGGPFQFYMSELMGGLAVGYSYARGISDNWLWFRVDTNIALFFAAIGVSVSVLTRAVFVRDGNRTTIFPALVFLPAALVCFGWEFSGHTVLQGNVYAPWMYPAAFLACGAGLAAAPRLNATVMIAITVLSVVVLGVVASKASFQPSVSLRFVAAALVVAACASAVWRYSGILIAASLIGLVGITYPSGGYGYEPWLRSVRNDRELYEQMEAAHEFILANYRARPVFWISASQGALPDARLISGTFLECSVPASFPSATRLNSGWDRLYPDLSSKVSSGEIRAGQRLFIISQGQNLADRARNSLSSLGLVGRPVVEAAISPEISIAAIDIERDQEGNKPQAGAPPVHGFDVKP